MKIPPATAKKFHSAIIFYRAARFRGGLVAMGKQCACGATRGWREDRVAGGDYMLFFVLPSGWFGAYGATYCLWLLMGKQCACGATQGWRGDRVAGGDYMLFLFCHAGGFSAYGATYC
ncbi:MAG: hypothetical protein HFJ87_04870 [Muribaculaceae bacterium]|nr:hypothetical protein [Muribaculaceae bacterium]